MARAAGGSACAGERSMLADPVKVWYVDHNNYLVRIQLRE